MNQLHMTEDGEPGRRERRRRAMIHAARGLFLERGVDAVSLADIVRASGGSLSTLYELFDSKQGLLAAIIGEHRVDGLARIEAIDASDDPPAIKVRAIAEALHDEYTSPMTIGLMRLVVAESLRSPRFGHEVFETLHLPFVRRLASLFDGWNHEGRAHIPDPCLAAELLLALLVHPAQMHGFFGAPNCLPSPHREAAIQDATRLFVSGYAIEEGSR